MWTNDRNVAQSARSTVVVTSRPVDIDRRAFADVLPVPKVAIDQGHGESFVRTALEGPTDDDKDRSSPFREVTLLPFTDDEIAEIARGQGVKNPEKLLDEIRADTLRTSRAARRI